jgi:hypothetical protein
MKSNLISKNLKKQFLKKIIFTGHKSEKSDFSKIVTFQVGSFIASFSPHISITYQLPVKILILADKSSWLLIYCNF